MRQTIQLKPFLAASIAALMLLVGGLAGVLIGRAGNDQDRAATSNQIGPLEGGWQMTSLEVGFRGDLQKVPYSGQITFDQSGRVAVQALNPDTTAADTEFTVSGYEAWAGRITVDQQAGTFTARVDTAAARTMIGTDQSRRFTIRGDTLVLTPSDASGAFRATYQRW